MVSKRREAFRGQTPYYGMDRGKYQGPGAAANQYKCTEVILAIVGKNVQF